ncbi:hypothetical protein [Salaquimonas pukyongi]|uniref:hypothetical protein n=1 Tax=Salaquimonas pukyongi TaxID=2712698 RepID=UPI00096B7459|nr:hypothetical protein [Salaquimonas pukyongi]
MASHASRKAESYTSPGFCRFDAAGIHILHRYAQEYLIRWSDVKGLEMPQGNCRHDYLKVVTTGKRFANLVPVAEAASTGAALAAIAKYRPDLAG